MQTATFKPLTNRTAPEAGAGFALPEDGFYQIVPRGAAPNVLNKKPVLQQVDEAALEAMRAELVNRGGEILVDQDHLSHDLSNATDALAWIVCEADALEIREDGLYNKARLTTLGTEKLTGGVVRFCSPEFGTAKGELTWLSETTLRPLRLTGAGFTNRPAFRNAAALTNRADDAPHEPTAQQTMQNKALARLLGITEEALTAMDEAALTAAVDASLARMAEAEKQVQEMMNREVDALLEANKEVLPESNAPLRNMVRQTLLKNRADGEVILEGLKSAHAAFKATEDPAKARADHKPLYNRSGAVTPPAVGNEDAAIEKLHNRARAIKNATPGMLYRDALAQARSEA